MLNYNALIIKFLLTRKEILLESYCESYLMSKLTEKAEFLPNLFGALPKSLEFSSSDGYEQILRTNGIELLTGRSNPELARQVGRQLAMLVDEPISVFDDEEIRVKIGPNIRGKDVFIIQSTSGNKSIPSSPSDSVMEAIFMLDASIRASAQRVHLITPYSAYSRQDKKGRPREPISAARVARNFEQAGASRILTVDMHSEQQQGNVDIPWDNIYASAVFVPTIQKTINSGKLDIEKLVFVAPDHGSAPRASKYRDLLHSPREIAIVDKTRDPITGKSKIGSIVGDVSDADAIIVDDLLSTGGTLTQAADYVTEGLPYNDRARSVNAFVTHAVLSDDATDKIARSSLDEVHVTDSIALHSDMLRTNPKLKVDSIAPLLAAAIVYIVNGNPLSELIPKSDQNFSLPHIEQSRVKPSRLRIRSHPTSGVQRLYQPVKGLLWKPLPSRDQQ